MHSNSSIDPYFGQRSQASARHCVWKWLVVMCEHYANTELDCLQKKSIYFPWVIHWVPITCIQDDDVPMVNSNSYIIHLQYNVTDYTLPLGGGEAGTIVPPPPPHFLNTCLGSKNTPTPMVILRVLLMKGEKITVTSACCILFIHGILFTQTLVNNAEYLVDTMTPSFHLNTLNSTLINRLLQSLCTSKMC